MNRVAKPLLMFAGAIAVVALAVTVAFRAKPERQELHAELDNEVSSAKAVILGPQASIAEKMAALRTLRSANARSDDVVRMMIQAYYSTEEPGLRADIFRQLEGVTTPELKAPLLEAVSKAADPGVREEAAETLFSYLPDHDVKAWLEHLATNDRAEPIRKQAAESLRIFSRR